MNAIIQTGGKQYLVKEGQTLEVELLGDAKKHTFEALMTIDGDKIVVGAPFVSGITVTAELLGETKGDKIKVLRYKAKKRIKRLTGHRQHYSEIKITGIGPAKADKAEKKEAKPAAAKA